MRSLLAMMSGPTEAPPVGGPVVIDYTGTAWNSPTGGGNTYKEVTLAVAPGDLLVAMGGAESAGNFPGNNAIATQSGSTSAWTVQYPAAVNNDDCGAVVGWATVTSGTTVTVRVSVNNSNFSANYQMAGVVRIHAGGWQGTPTITLMDPPNGTGNIPVTVNPTSVVVYAGYDWSAVPPVAYTPGGGTVHDSYGDNSHYAGAIVTWKDQTADDDYGEDTSGKDFVGAVVVVKQT